MVKDVLDILCVLMGPDELLLVAVMAASCDEQNVELRFIAFAPHLESILPHTG